MKTKNSIKSGAYLTVKYVIVGVFLFSMFGCEKVNELVNKNTNSNTSEETTNSSNVKNSNAANSSKSNENVANLKTDNAEKTSSPSVPPANVEKETGQMKPTEVYFDEPDFEFGTISEGEIVIHSYRFKNSGTTPLAIEKVSSNCTCVTADFPKEPVPPGGMSKIVVRFDSKGKPGNRRQKLEILANINPTASYLYLTGEVRTQ